MSRGCRLILWIALAVSMSGCASYFKRKECEKANWYQHGYNVAMSGKRLDADDFVKQCQKVEAKMSWTELDTGFKAGMGKYCTQDNVFAVGKAGKPFSYDMCDGESMKKMKASYTKGLMIFCTPSNAYRFGSTGGVYENVCPKDDEDAFLTEYRKGRKVWLKANIEEKEKEVARLDTEIATLEGQRSMLNARQAGLAPLMTTVRHERVYDPATGNYKEQVTQVPNESVKMQSEQLSREISDVGYQIQSKRSKQSQLNNELSQMRTEMAAL